MCKQVEVRPACLGDYYPFALVCQFSKLGKPGFDLAHIDVCCRHSRRAPVEIEHGKVLQCGSVIANYFARISPQIHRVELYLRRSRQVRGECRNLLSSLSATTKLGQPIGERTIGRRRIRIASSVIETIAPEATAAVIAGHESISSTARSRPRKPSLRIRIIAGD